MNSTSFFQRSCSRCPPVRRRCYVTSRRAPEGARGGRTRLTKVRWAAAAVEEDEEREFSFLAVWGAHIAAVFVSCSILIHSPVASPYHRNTNKLVGGAAVCLRRADKSDRKPSNFFFFFPWFTAVCVFVPWVTDWRCCLDWWPCPLPVTDFILVERRTRTRELAHWLVVVSTPLKPRTTSVTWLSTPPPQPQPPLLPLSSSTGQQWLGPND